MTDGRWRPPLVRLALAALFVALMLWRLDLKGGVERLPDIEPGWVLGGLVAFTASKVVSAYRWRSFLAERDRIALAPLTAIFVVGNLANALVPLRAGDLLRIELPSRRFGIPRAELASSVLVVESVLDGVAFAVLFMVALPFLDVPGAWRPVMLVAGVVVVFTLVGTVLLARMSVTREYERVWPLRWLRADLRATIGRAIPQFIEGTSALRTPRRALEVVGISIGAWTVEVGVYMLMSRAFDVPLTPAEAAVVMIAANLIVSVPLTPWDFGPYELLVAETMVLLGWGRAEASGFALGSHLLLQLWIATTGLIAMLALGMRPMELIRGRPTGGTS